MEGNKSIIPCAEILQSILSSKSKKASAAQIHRKGSIGIPWLLLPVQGNMVELDSQYIPHSHPQSTQRSN